MCSDTRLTWETDTAVRPGSRPPSLFLSPRRCGTERSLRPASSGHTASPRPPPAPSSSRSQCSRSPTPSATTAVRAGGGSVWEPGGLSLSPSGVEMISEKKLQCKTKTAGLNPSYGFKIKPSESLFLILLVKVELELVLICRCLPEELSRFRLWGFGFKSSECQFVSVTFKEREMLMGTQSGSWRADWDHMLCDH